MAMRGLDYAWSRVPPPLVKAAGFGFAARYLSRDPSKNLTRAEADALLAAGVAIVVVWEDAAQGALRGHAGGVADALAADAQARACGLPGAFIYFAADWDATGGDQIAINAYLDGCATVIGRARTGLYGGFWPCTRARMAGKASKFWGTVAWSGRNWDTVVNPNAWKPDVMQGAQVTVDGVSVDLDTGGADGPDFGQWPRPVPTAATAPEVHDMVILNVDKATVPKGTPWPGIFLLSGPPASLWHIPNEGTYAAYQALGVPEKVRPYADWLLLGGVPAVPA